MKKNKALIAAQKAFEQRERNVSWIYVIIALLILGTVCLILIRS